MSDFMKIRRVGAELFHVDIHTGRQDEGKKLRFQILRTCLKMRTFDVSCGVLNR